MQEKIKRLLFWGFLTGLSVAVASEITRSARRRRRALARRIHRETYTALQMLATPAHARSVTVGDVRLHTVVAGPQDGPLAVLLHGFPEHWYSWRHQIPQLAEMGYRVVAPDQRGYNLSDKPADIAAYRIDRLTADVLGLIRALGHKKATLLGHDWGGVVAWRCAMDAPSAVERLVVMNAPHPQAFARELRQGWNQRLRSWYALFFQLPWLPEALLGFAPRATAHFFFRRTATRPQAFDDNDLTRMAAAMAQPGALHAMLNWYRAALRFPVTSSPRRIETPTLLLWGEDDVALSKTLTFNLAAWVPQIHVRYLLNCGHWVQNEAPDEVNAHLRAFLQR
ncbi:MAG: alpha/beta fold hydrolase [Anaerolineae bacterium]